MIEENIPNGLSNFAMKRKIVHRLSIPHTHSTPVNHNDTSLPEIVHGKDLT
jgi:hypothetical protein